MGSKELSQALVKRSADTALMPPPPKPKRIKRPSTVLEEDTYVDALSHIISRDFFPGLQEVEAQQEYLDALDSKDDEWIADSGRRLTKIMIPGPESKKLRGRRGTNFPNMTPLPSGTETPGFSTPSTTAAAELKPQIDLSLSLSAFQAKYTSEDNESFNALLDKQNTKRAEKHAWLWSGNKIPSGRQLLYRQAQERLLEARASPSTSSMDMTLYKHTDARPAKPDYKPSAPRNSLMFEPDSIEDTHETVAQASAARSTMPPKSIAHSATRIPAPELPTQPNRPSSPTMSEIDDALAGKPRHAPDSSAGGWETPRVGGYAFVDEEPTRAEMHAYNSPASNLSATSQTPDEPPSVAATPNLLSALVAQDASSAPNPFKVAEAGRREKLHHAMVERTSRSRRADAHPQRHSDGTNGGGPWSTPGVALALGRTPAPKCSTAPRTPAVGIAGGGGGGGKKQAGELTPAGQRLLGKIGTSSTRRREVDGGYFGEERREGGGGAAGGKGTRLLAGLTPRRSKLGG